MGSRLSCCIGDTSDVVVVPCVGQPLDLDRMSKLEAQVASLMVTVTSLENELVCDGAGHRQTLDRRSGPQIGVSFDLLDRTRISVGSGLESSIGSARECLSAHGLAPLPVERERSGSSCVLLTARALDGTLSRDRIRTSLDDMYDDNMCNSDACESGQPGMSAREDASLVGTCTGDEARGGELEDGLCEGQMSFGLGDIHLLSQ